MSNTKSTRESLIQACDEILIAQLVDIRQQLHDIHAAIASETEGSQHILTSQAMVGIEASIGKLSEAISLLNVGVGVFREYANRL